MQLYIDNHNITDPFVNLALEEYCLRSLPSEHNYLLIYINEPAALIGRHQNIPEEIDLSYARRHAIKVVRRISGGGAVYHDAGNLNYCLIQNFNHLSLSQTKRYLRPVLRVLQKMGVAAEINDRNDITVDQHKISGTAQFSNTRRLMVHGTLLFDTDLDSLRRVLTPNHRRIHSRALKSIRSPVTNIYDRLPQPMDMDRFRKLFAQGLAGAMGGAQTRRLNRRDWEAVLRLAAEKYRTWNWNFAKAPPFEMHVVAPFAAGVGEIRFAVQEGIIRDLRCVGSAFPDAFSTGLERRLNGIRYDRDEIHRRLEDLQTKGVDPSLTAGYLAERLC